MLINGVPISLLKLNIRWPNPKVSLDSYKMEEDCGQDHDMKMKIYYFEKRDIKMENGSPQMRHILVSLDSVASATDGI